MWSPSKTFAQDVSNVKDGDITEVAQKNKKWIDVHGMVRWWSNVTPLLWSVLGDKPALMLNVDVSNPQTWLWAAITRMDDFNKNMDNPASQATIFDVYYQKKIKKASVYLYWEYTTLDKLKWGDSFTPIVWCTYNAWKWWNLDTWYCHSFQKGNDCDFVRLWVTKGLNKSLSIAIQGFYRSDLPKNFYGRISADINLWNGFWAQISFIAKEWKVTPVAWVFYKF